MAETLTLILSFLTLAGVIFAIFKFFRDPDIKAQEEINLINQRCDMRHKVIDGHIVSIKENHLKHLEQSVSNIEKNIIKIFTILEERNKK
jgi:hypothetical protein